MNYHPNHYGACLFLMLSESIESGEIELQLPQATALISNELTSRPWRDTPLPVLEYTEPEIIELPLPKVTPVTSNEQFTKSLQHKSLLAVSESDEPEKDGRDRVVNHSTVDAKRSKTVTLPGIVEPAAQEDKQEPCLLEPESPTTRDL
jgi:hypothetical protein